MKNGLVVLLIFTSFLYSQDMDTDWQTYYERSFFKETPRYSETIAYCKKLADASPMIHFTYFGQSPQGRALPLLVVDKNGNFTAGDVRKTDNVVFMIQAGIHAGESDGKDAGLMLIRDLVILRQNIELLDNITLLFIPVFNVDGHERFGPYNRINQNGPEEMGWRSTAQNYNLNRDYLKADSPEMQAFLTLYNQWLPDFFADCHVTNGADYQYAITYIITNDITQNDSVRTWVNKSYLPSIYQKMNEENLPIINYVTFLTEHDPSSGIEGGVSKPRFSTGFNALHNRPGLLIETHMLKDYRTRVSATYSMLINTIEILDTERIILKNHLQTADQSTRDKKFREKELALSFKLTDHSKIIEFLGFKYSVEKSQLSGGDWYRYSNDDTVFNVPYYDSVITVHSARLPHAYIIPVEWTEIIKRIERHGIEFFRLDHNQEIKVKSYKFSDVKWAPVPYENHHTVNFKMKEIEEQRIYPSGSVVIPMDQRRAKVIANILEPQAMDSYVFWGFFDPVFERKEYAESYVMEEFARFMLASDETLKKEFEEKKAADKKFASNPKLILDWFYQRSPYWDNSLNLYPVGKIFDYDILDTLKNKSN